MIRDENGSHTSSVVITGDSSQQKKAEEMIQSLIDENLGQQQNSSSNFFSQTSSLTKPETKSTYDDVATIDWGAVIKNSVSFGLEISNILVMNI